MDLKIKKNIQISNKKAHFLYDIQKKYVAGIVLNGTEVKAIRMSSVSINEAFCYFKKSELYVKNMNISEYKFGTYLNHKPNRERKLLLNKKELKALENKIKERGFTIIPIELKMSETGYVKLEIGLAQGKKVFDKRQSIKEKDNKRELDRLKKRF
jgi:SsrA-binding protein